MLLMDFLNIKKLNLKHLIKNKIILSVHTTRVKEVYCLDCLNGSNLYAFFLFPSLSVFNINIIIEEVFPLLSFSKNMDKSDEIIFIN